MGGPRVGADLGSPPGGPDEDFFDVGGGSLAAAQLVTLLRERFPEVTIADVYHPIRHRQGSPRSSTSSQPPRPDE